MGIKTSAAKKDITSEGILKMINKAFTAMSLTIFVHPDMKKRAKGPFALSSFSKSTSDLYDAIVLTGDALQTFFEQFKMF